MSELLINVKSIVSNGLESYFADFLSREVISRLSKHRGQHFFSSLINSMKNELDSRVESCDLDHAIRKVFSIESSKETLFESYRRVCLSASKELGPRIIGILTAIIVLEDRLASEEEEVYFELAESMKDVELIDLCVYIDKLVEIKNPISIELGSIEIDSNSPRNSSSIQAPSVISELGRWAAKLQQHGFLDVDTLVSSYTYEEDSEKHIDMPGVVTKYEHVAILQYEVLHFCSLIKRAQGPEIS